MAKPCRICGIFQKEGWTVENIAGEPASEKFPDEYDRLITYNVAKEGNFEGYYKESTLQCPECGFLYSYACSLPGGSHDAMRTWIVEKISPMLKHGKHMKKNVSRKIEITAAAESEYRCPTCGSGDVEQTGGGSLGGQVFFSVKCNNCGDEDTLDEYQQGRWLR